MGNVHLTFLQLREAKGGKYLLDINCVLYQVQTCLV